MPVCQKCRTFVAVGEACAACGSAHVEVTVTDPLIASVTTQSMRPSGRPPTGILIALDDDSDVDGQQFRLRHSETTLGRNDCDVSIANDADISGQHAMIVRTVDVKERYRWTLRDRDSTNGTFVRVNRWTLDDATDLTLGAVPLHWQSGDASSPCRLSELIEGGRTFRLKGRESLFIGREPAAVDIGLRDATVSREHAELTFDGRFWTITDNNSRNGVWVRVREYELQNNGAFMIGQQRFLFRDGCVDDCANGISIEVPG